MAILSNRALFITEQGRTVMNAGAVCTFQLVLTDHKKLGVLHRCMMYIYCVFFAWTLIVECEISFVLVDNGCPQLYGGEARMISSLN